MQQKAGLTQIKLLKLSDNKTNNRTRT